MDKTQLEILGSRAKASCLSGLTSSVALQVTKPVWDKASIMFQTRIIELVIDTTYDLARFFRGWR